MGGVNMPGIRIRETRKFADRGWSAKGYAAPVVTRPSVPCSIRERMLAVANVIRLNLSLSALSHKQLFSNPDGRVGNNQYTNLGDDDDQVMQDRRGR
jgi:hypothetical protein